jgi:hypothetical protein
MRTEFSFDNSGWFRTSELYVELATTCANTFIYLTDKSPVRSKKKNNQSASVGIHYFDEQFQIRFSLVYMKITFWLKAELGPPTHLK